MAAEGEFYVHREWSEVFREPLEDEEYHIVSPGFKEFCESVHMAPVTGGLDDFDGLYPGYWDRDEDEGEEEEEEDELDDEEDDGDVLIVLDGHLLSLFASSFKERRRPSEVLGIRRAANLIYEITGNVTKELMDEMTALTVNSVYRFEDGTERCFKYPDCAARIELFKRSGLGLRFLRAESVEMAADGTMTLTGDLTFQRNLLQLDTKTSQILADMAVEAYFNGIVEVWMSISALEVKDRFRIGTARSEDPFYRDRVMDLVEAMACHMNASEPWDGTSSKRRGYMVGWAGGPDDFDGREGLRDKLYEVANFDTLFEPGNLSTGIIERGGRYHMVLGAQFCVNWIREDSRVAVPDAYYDAEAGRYLGGNPVSTRQLRANRAPPSHAHIKTSSRIDESEV